MTAKDLEKELFKLDPAFSVSENPNRPGLSNIFYMGKNYDLPVISTHLIKDDPDPSHRYEFPNGMSARHHSKPEIMDRINQFLKDYKEGKLKGYDE